MTYQMGTDGSRWQGLTHPAIMRKYVVDCWPGQEPWVSWKISQDVYADPTWMENVQKSKDAGYALIGGYHFYGTGKPWKAQANYYLEQWDKAGVNLVPCLDLERASAYPYPGPLYQQDVLAWLEYVTIHTGIEPMIYSSPAWITSYIRATTFRRYPLWLAHWDVAAPKVPKPWFPGLWAAWQVGYYDALGFGVESRTLDINVAQNLPTVEQAKALKEGSFRGPSAAITHRDMGISLEAATYLAAGLKSKRNPWWRRG